MAERWKSRINALSVSLNSRPAPEVEAAIRAVLIPDRVLLSDDVIVDFAEKVSHGFTLNLT